MDLDGTHGRDGRGRSSDRAGAYILGVVVVVVVIVVVIVVVGLGLHAESRLTALRERATGRVRVWARLRGAPRGVSNRSVICSKDITYATISTYYITTTCAVSQRA